MQINSSDEERASIMGDRIITANTAIALFVESYSPMGWDNEPWQELARVNHNIVIYWVRQVGEQLPNAPDDAKILAIAQADELQTFTGSKKRKSGCG